MPPSWNASADDLLGGPGPAVADPHDPVGHGREQRLIVADQGDRQPGQPGGQVRLSQGDNDAAARLFT
jgi:hypothetical protein